MRVLGSWICMVNNWHTVDLVVALEIIVVLGPWWRRYKQLGSSFLHALIHTVDAVDTAISAKVLGQEEEGTEADDAEGEEHEEYEILLARAEGTSGKQLGRLRAADDALVARQESPASRG